MDTIVASSKRFLSGLSSVDGSSSDLCGKLDRVAKEALSKEPGSADISPMDIPHLVNAVNSFTSRGQRNLERAKNRLLSQLEKESFAARSSIHQWRKFMNTEDDRSSSWSEEQYLFEHFETPSTSGCQTGSDLGTDIVKTDPVDLALITLYDKCTKGSQVVTVNCLLGIWRNAITADECNDALQQVQLGVGLMVSENPALAITEILAPLDFSKDSIYNPKMALGDLCRGGAIHCRASTPS
jgi:hypothetical protein